MATRSPTSSAMQPGGSLLWLQPWVLGPTAVEALPRATCPAHFHNGAATVRGGDKVQIVGRADQDPSVGLVEQVLHKAREVNGRILPAGSLCVSSLSTSSSSGSVFWLLPDQAASNLRKCAKLLLVAPGGGVESLGSVWQALGADSRFQVEAAGRKGTLYDRYPAGWPGGGGPPNLASFAEDLVKIGLPQQTDCFLFASRGGQVVLPVLWRFFGDAVPPSVVINGGCSMAQMPGPRVRWPDRAVTLMIMGGLDYFRGHAPPQEYLRNSCSLVPPTNCTTALIYIPEMEHMPKPEMLGPIMPLLVEAALAWQSQPNCFPDGLFRAALIALESRGWGGRARYTIGAGAWREVAFGIQVPDRLPAPPMAKPPREPPPPPKYPLGTAISVLPIELAVGRTAEEYRETAEEARMEAQVSAARAQALEESLQQQRRALGAATSSELEVLQRHMHEEHALQERLLEFAAGQEAEAYAAESERQPQQAAEPPPVVNSRQPSALREPQPSPQRPPSYLAGQASELHPQQQMPAPPWRSTVHGAPASGLHGGGYLHAASQQPRPPQLRPSPAAEQAVWRS